MVAFAGNSLLCRAALDGGHIDAGSFTAIRLFSGAACLLAIALFRKPSLPKGGSWTSGFALFAYAAAFSFAYLSLSAATGALLLFGAVQATMIAYGLWRGERFRTLQLVGLALAIGGLIGLLAPGVSAPPLTGAVLMLGAGVAWGMYSLRGHRGGDPIRVTAGNFAYSVLPAYLLVVLMRDHGRVDLEGVALAVVSGIVASGMGYALWYTVLPALRSTTAATVQLSVPVITALGGVLLLGESLNLRLVLASVVILGGIWMVIANGQREQTGS